MRSVRRTIFVAFSLAGLVLLAAVTVEAKPMKFQVSAMGSGSDTSHSAAVSAAKEDARSKLMCTGTLEDVQAKSSGCAKVDGNYLCTAMASGTCVLGH